MRDNLDELTEQLEVLRSQVSSCADEDDVRHVKSDVDTLRKDVEALQLVTNSNAQVVSF